MKAVYTSKYTDRKLTAAQKIAEVICEKQATKRAEQLIYRFWNSPKWEKEFKTQLFFANSLLKLYSLQAILAGLKDKRAYGVYSLGAAFILDEIFKEEQAKLDKAEAEFKDAPAPEEKQVVMEKPRPKFQQKGKNLLSKLEGL
jgi:hypothetical protein